MSSQTNHVRSGNLKNIVYYEAYVSVFHKPLNWIKQLTVLCKAEFHSSSDNMIFFFSDIK